MKRLAVVCAMLLFAPLAFAEQAALATFSYHTTYSPQPLPLPPEPSPAPGYVAVLDLHGDIAPEVTSFDATCKSPHTVSFKTTREFAGERHTFVAITANTGPQIGSLPCGVPDGLMMSNSQWVNWPQWQGPVLYFPSNSSAVITDQVLPWISKIQNAVAGSTGQDSDCATGQLGTLLVKDGAPGECPIPKSGTTAPRGAIGLDATGQYLIILVVGGIENTYGLQTSDFARLMIAFGAENAVNFDGGGSTAFFWYSDFGTPTECTECAKRIADSALSPKYPSPYQLAFTKPLPLPLGSTILYSASKNPERKVYASIGFRLNKLQKK